MDERDPRLKHSNTSGRLPLSRSASTSTGRLCSGNVTSHVPGGPHRIPLRPLRMPRCLPRRVRSPAPSARSARRVCVGRRGGGGGGGGCNPGPKRPTAAGKDDRRHFEASQWNVMPTDCKCLGWCPYFDSFGCGGPGQPLWLSPDRETYERATAEEVQTRTDSGRY